MKYNSAFVLYELGYEGRMIRAHTYFLFIFEPTRLDAIRTKMSATVSRVHREWDARADTQGVWSEKGIVEQWSHYDCG